MQQSQLRLGDILDDYCPRERRVTNHAVVAMVGSDVKQTRCTTCDSEHEYKHAKVPRQRKKTDSPAVVSSTHPPPPTRIVAGADPLAGASPPGVQRQAHVLTTDSADEVVTADASRDEDIRAVPGGSPRDVDIVDELSTEASDESESRDDLEEGPVHRRLIRATLPRLEGQAPPTRQAPDFTIRQPAGRANRFRPRQQRGGQFAQGNRNGNVAGGQNHGGSFRQPPGRQHVASRSAKRHGPGRKRSK